MNSNLLLSAKKLTKTFGAPAPLTLFENIDLDFSRGSSSAIIGPSGEGKTTLLHILGTLEHATSGELFFQGNLISSGQHAALRNKEIGFIFQSFHLLEDYTVLENILIPLQIGRCPAHPQSEEYQYAIDLLDAIGMSGFQNRSIKPLSGGEKQRVAIARALVRKPSLLMADEPTGNLDHHTSEIIQELLLRFAKEYQKTLILVTHDLNFAQKCDFIYELNDKQLICK